MADTSDAPPPAGHNGRNPTKKRGRPRSAHNRYDLAALIGSKKRNYADMVNAVNHGLPEELREEFLSLADRGETTLTVLAYLARFPPEQQRKMFPLLNRLGSRGAKRYVECLTRPPSAEAIGERIARWVTREFPSLDWDEVIAGCRQAVAVLRAMQIALRDAPAPAEPDPSTGTP